MAITDPGSEAVGDRVFRAVAARKEAIPIEQLPPLNEAVNVDALNAIFAARFDGTPRTAGYVEFPYCGYWVTVYANGEIDVEERSGTRE